MSRVIIAGSRSFGRGISDKIVRKYIDETIDELPIDPSVVVHGGARGADQAAGEWAPDNVDVDEHEITEDMWDRHGNKAAYFRNLGMAWHGDYLVAFWDGESAGTRMMIDIAEDVLGEDRVFVDRYRE